MALTTRQPMNMGHGDVVNVPSGQDWGFSFTNTWGPSPMNSRDFCFLIELMMDTTERCLIAALQENPRDTAARAAYADLLEERGRMKSARWIRDGYTPGGEWVSRQGEGYVQSFSGAVSNRPYAGHTPPIPPTWGSGYVPHLDD